MVEISLVCDKCGNRVGPISCCATACFVNINHLADYNGFHPFADQDLCSNCSAELRKTWEYSATVPSWKEAKDE